jgi:hypothetical protein
MRTRRRDRAQVRLDLGSDRPLDPAKLERFVAAMRVAAALRQS